MLLPLYILAGGRSSRFGSDKARALVDGQPLITRIAHALAPISASVTVIAPTGQYDDLGLNCIPDDQPDLGPIGGLAAALGHHRDGWLMLASCDLVEITPAWFEHLWSHRRDDALAIVMRDDHWQSLAALYHTAALPTVRSLIAAGHRAMHRLLATLSPRAIPVPRPAHLLLRQANTPADLPG